MDHIATRQLRLRIARQRRRIDARLRAVKDESRRLVSWRTYVRAYPGSAILAALGAGLSFSAGLSFGRIAHWLGLRMVRSALDRVAGSVWDELRRVWAESAPPQSSRSDSEGRA